jgi:hypothetical protein
VLEKVAEEGISSKREEVTESWRRLQNKELHN